MLTVLAALWTMLVLAGCGSSHSSTPTRRGPPLESIFGPSQGELLDHPVATLATLRSLGVGRVKLYMPWNALAPDSKAAVAPPGFQAGNPAAYPAAAWAPYDAVVRQAAAQRIGVDLTVGGPPPAWVAAPGSPAPAPQWKPSPAAFGAFVHAVGERYSGAYRGPGSSSPLPRVSFWAIWNEPNYGPDLAPQATHHSTIEASPALYRGLVDAAWTALQVTGHGQDIVLIGELAPRGQTVGNNPGSFSGMVPLRFVRALYCLDSQLAPLRGSAATARGCPGTPAASHAFASEHPALFRAEFSVHPYPQGRQPPDVPTTIEPDYADLAALPNLEHLLDWAASVYGSARRLPIYSTEFGYITDPPQRIERAVAVNLAAEYLNWSEYISWRDPRILSYNQFLLSDPPAGSGSAFDSGLEYAGGAPKPTFSAYRLPLFLPRPSAQSSRATEVWGCVRPMTYARSQPVAQIEEAPSAAGPWSVLRRVQISDPHGYFDVLVKFRHSGLVRVAWSSPSGSTIYSRLATITVHT